MISRAVVESQALKWLLFALMTPRLHRRGEPR